MAAAQGLGLVVLSMAGSLFSSRWYRIAALRPQLRAQVELRRQDQRGTPWFLLLDETTEDVRRLDRLAYDFVGRCDGASTVQQIWEALLASDAEAVMTQDQVLELLVALHDRGLIEFDSAPNVAAFFRSRGQRQRRQRLQGLNPLAFRLALADPSRLLRRLAPLASRFFAMPALLVWALAVSCAGVAAAVHGGELAAHASRLMAAPRYLLLTWLMYPFIKALHETAHGLAVQRHGGTVRQAGVTLLMLTPVPFVNASAADAFRHRHQRALVSAAGIMAELAVAAVAMGVWLLVQPGLVKDLALLAMLIGAVSTVLVNGNPLMRLDGYYLLGDLLDLRNLGTRSSAWWREFLARRLLGAQAPATVVPMPGERPWLVGYAPLATAYRLGLSLGIGLWVGSHSSLLGVAVGGLIAWSTVLRPLYGGLRAVFGASRDPGRAWRPLAAGVALAAAVALVPLPFSTLAQGVVWLPDRAQVRAGTDGFIAGFEVADGAQVHAGDLIARLSDERLEAARTQLAADATDLEVAMFQAMTAEPDKVPALREKLAYSRAEATRNDERIAQLEVRAAADGVLVLPHPADQLGTYRKKGELIAYLLTDDPLTVRVALPQDDADLVRRDTAQARTTVGVRLAEEGYRLRSGQLRRDLDAAVTQLPSAALGEVGGGAIAIDASDKEGLTASTPVVLMDVEVASGTPSSAPPRLGERIGARAQVRFDHGTLPMAQQVLRKFQQLVLQHFNPAA